MNYFIPHKTNNTDNAMIQLKFVICYCDICATVSLFIAKSYC